MDKKTIKKFVDFIKKHEQEDPCDQIVYTIYPTDLINFLTDELLCDEGEVADA